MTIRRKVIPLEEALLPGERLSPAGIRLLVSDVDGTLVTGDKRLTPRVEAAARALGEAGIALTVTSSRPAFGMRMLIEPLGLTTPMAAFNGGLIVSPDRLRPIECNPVPVDVARRGVELLVGHGVGIWIHTEHDWFVLDPAGPYVDHEIRTIRTAPTVVTDFDRPGVIDRAYKIVGVSQNFALLARCERELADEFGARATVARSQLYYLDVTHPLANKGHAVQRLSHLLAIAPSQIAAIGDGGNDIAMFAVAGLAIAMGNAEAEVQQAADCVSAGNEEDGFAVAVERWILPRAARAGARRAHEGSP
jgi:Cof subfamily protein (haloacid dehalogenase superfamily)